MATIKETLEVFAALKVTVTELKAALADGKFGFDDLPRLLTVMNTLNTAAQGMKDIPAELKDLDQAEVAQLIAASAEIVMIIVEIVKGIMQPKA